MILSSFCRLGILVICVGYTYSAITSESDRNSITRNFDAKGMLASIANTLMSRGISGLAGTAAPGTSQVVSLNITNLVVLVLIKALIFAAGSIGAGTWKGGFARSIDGAESWFTDEELLLQLSYLTGKPGDYGCLQSIACLQPQQARKYASAGKMLMKTAASLSLEANPGYNQVLKELEEAASWGSVGGDCKRYSCGPNENN